MRILHTSDWHLGKTLHEHSLIEDQKHFLDQLLDVLKRDPHHALIIAGDIYDRSVPPREAVQLLSDFLSRFRSEIDIPVLLIPGNHDSASRLSYLSTIVKDQNIHFLADLEDVGKPVRIGKADIYGIPFLSPYDLDLTSLEEKYQTRTHENALRAALENIQLNPRRLNILIAHLFATGGRTSDSERAFVGASGEIDIHILEKFDYVALGHLHRPQKVADNAHYSGSPLAYSFSESSDDKCLLSVQIQKEETEDESKPEKSSENADSFAEEATETNGQLALIAGEGMEPAEKYNKKVSTKSKKKGTARASKKKEISSRTISENAKSPDKAKFQSGGNVDLNIVKIPLEPLRPVSTISGFYDELLESNKFEEVKNHYLEIELKDETIAGSPMKGLSQRFPFLLSIRRQLHPSRIYNDPFPERTGNSMQDDFQSFQQYLYGDEPGPEDAGAELPKDLQTEKLSLFEKALSGLQDEGSSPASRKKQNKADGESD